MRSIALAVVFAVVVPFATAAQEASTSSETLLEAALSRASTLQAEPETVRSMTRTWWGVALVAGGTAIAASSAGTECVKSDLLSDFSGLPTCDEVASVISLGLIVAGTGALLATIWSDVPVVRDLSIGAAPGRVQVGRTFEW